MTFERKSAHSNVILWTGIPDCQTAHQVILQELSSFCTEFLSSAPSDDPHLNILKGNIGEFIGFCTGKWNGFASYQAFAANAFTPLSGIAKPDIDIVWLHFGDDPNNDIVVLQEIKTTGSSSLNYADRLIDDYEKLFGPDPAVTLQSRLQGIKNKIEYEHKRKDLCPRISRLGGVSPQTSLQVQLLPTLVYELTGSEPLKKMIAIRSSLCGLGWLPSSIEAWAIGLSDLNERIVKLAMGKL